MPHERAIAKALLQSEAATLTALRKTVKQAVTTTLASVSHQTQLATTINDAADALAEDAETVIQQGQLHARKGSRRAQETAVATLLLWPSKKPPDGVLGVARLTEIDAARASLSGRSLGSAWGQSALQELETWRRTGGDKLNGLVSRIKGTAKVVDGKASNIATTEVATAANSEAKAVYAEAMAHPYRTPGRVTPEPAIKPGTVKPRPRVEVAPAERRAVKSEVVSLFKVRWSASLDKRTCDTCSGLDGQVTEAGGSFSGGAWPPVHSRCRCVVVPTK